jgi:hypothetical protein
VLGWGMFLAAWMCLSVDIASDTSYCSVRESGHHYPGPRYKTPCNTMYAAYAFALVEWMLFTVSLAYVVSSMIQRLPSLPPIVEKDEAPNIEAAMQGDWVV